ncbi:MAG: hypothetical protein H6577_04015 [Lewinellaceae bacterium]|nr:hypothetical protein [Saprospiraceae bacterium]MCB9337270.1 hypothetical protein [Lewinellaceae bacterium]
MKNIKFLFLPLFVVALFSSCDKYENSAEPSFITYLPKLTVSGSPNITLECDATSYSDAGGTAEEQGKPIDLITTVKPKYFGGSTVDGPDVYTILYSAENKDGIPGAAERTVTWKECNGDLVSSIAGMYTAYLSRTTKSSGAVLASAQYQGVGPVIIRDLGNNQYGISDAIGGWYEFGRSLGVSYAAIGQTITANNIPANDFTFGPAVEVGGFGGVNTLTSFKVFPSESKIVFTTDWEAGFTFEVTLIQNP